MDLKFLLDILYILIGFVLLVKGGDWLVNGSVGIARKAKLSSMVIGMTVIGFGTSAPELFVSLQAAIAGSPGLSIGNVVGSNIANIGMILGATAMIVPCVTKKQTLMIDVPVMILACLLLAGIGLTGTIGRIAGLVGMLILITFITFEINKSRKLSKKADSIEENSEPVMALWKAIPLVIFSLGILVLGANLLIDGASNIAREIGEMVDADPKDMERIIGLTIVAVGTSLPELFASIMAAKKGQAEMAVGNIIGSVTFNVFCGIGLTALICPIHNTNIGFIDDYAIMCGLAILLWLFMFTKRGLERWEGITLLSIYIAYICWTVVS